MVKIRSKIKFLKTSFFYELVKLETLKKIFVMCHSIFALPIPPITVKSYPSLETARKRGSPLSELHPHFHFDPGESRGGWVTQKLNGT